MRYLWSVLLLMEIIGMIMRIGEPREPITRKHAVASLVLNGLLIVSILTGWWW